MFNLEFFTPSGVRLRRYSQSAGSLNWLFLPGGPGIGSESLHELAGVLDVPGSIWMVDLPGDGSNTAASDTTPFASWPGVLIEAAQALPNCVYAGHSTGGMYLLSTPELEKYLTGLVLISTAPNANWHASYLEMTRRNPLPGFDAAMKAFESAKTNARLRDVAVASAEWNFEPDSVARGRELLSRMPYNNDAVEWSDRNFDHSYVWKWWPSALPTLIVSGERDRIVDQHLWDDPRFRGDNVIHSTITRGGHFAWIENPTEVRGAFAKLVRMLPLNGLR